MDFDSNERMKDGLLCLLDFCMDRTRRLNNRKQRVQNLIKLVSGQCCHDDKMDFG